MKRVLARLATVAAAIGLVAAAAPGAAQAGTTTVPGCYGVGVVVCDLTIRIGAPIGVESYQTTLPVCAGTCTYVPVTLVRTTAGEPTAACYSYKDLAGNVYGECFTDGGGGGGIVEDVQRIVDGLDLEAKLQRLVDRINDLIGDGDACARINRLLYELGVNAELVCE